MLINRLLKLPVIAPVLAGLVLCLIQTEIASADVVQNKVTIKKLNARCVTVDFELAPVTTLHQLAAPQVPWDEFFNKYASMSEVTLNKELAKVRTAVEKNSRVADLEGKLFLFGGWKWPEARLWLDTLKAEQILYMTGSNNQGHAKPMQMHAQACSNQPVGTIMFSFDPTFYPLAVVAGENDQIALTRQVPYGTAEF